MARKKLEKMSTFKAFPNAFEGSTDLDPNWYRDHFENDHPLTLELACGWGEYTTALALKFPERNFIGVDIKGVRLWKGAKLAAENGLNNVAFLRCHIDDLADYFPTQCVDEIWLTFPDPHPKKSRSNKRLTARQYLSLYRQLIKPEGLIHLKTDNEILFDFTLATLREEECVLQQVTENLRYDSADESALAIQTKYEKKYLQQGQSIKYLCFTFGPSGNHID